MLCGKGGENRAFSRVLQKWTELGTEGFGSGEKRHKFRCKVESDLRKHGCSANLRESPLEPS